MAKGGAKNTMGEYERVPMGNGLLRHIPSGKFIHESKITGFEQMKGNRRKPPDILLKCHDVWGTQAMREIVLTPDMTFTDSLDFLQQNYGRRLLIEYQDRSGRVNRVDSLEAYEAFCAAAENSTPPGHTPPGHTPQVQVFLRDWKYEAPQFVGPPTRAPPGASTEGVPRNGKKAAGCAACFAAIGVSLGVTKGGAGAEGGADAEEEGEKANPGFFARLFRRGGKGGTEEEGGGEGGGDESEEED